MEGWKQFLEERERRQERREDEGHHHAQLAKPGPFQHQDQDDQASKEPQNGIFLPEPPPPDHLQDIDKEGNGHAHRQESNPVQPNLLMALIRKESVTLTI